MNTYLYFYFHTYPHVSIGLPLPVGSFVGLVTECGWGRESDPWYTDMGIDQKSKIKDKHC